ncbi:MAG: hypothetical protein AAGD28_06085 [Bacteroidota bacterium]
MLIINLSDQLKNHPHLIEGASHILDLRAKVLNEKSLDISFFGDAEEIFPHGLDAYKGYLQKLIEEDTEAKEFLDIKLNDIPLFWFTETAIKHSIFFWAKDYFLLLSLVELGSKIINEKFDKVQITLPQEILHFQPALEDILNAKGLDIPLEIIGLEPVSNISLAKLLKSCLGRSLKILRFSAPGKNTVNSKPQHLFLVNNTNNVHTQEKLYKPLKALFDEQNKELQILPFMEWIESSSSQAIPSAYYQAKPPIFQLLRLNIKIFRTFFRLKKTKIKDLMYDGFSYPASFIQYDLIKSLYHNIYIFYTQLWLSNYLKATPQLATLFFEDEFYQPGKCIISAASPLGIKTIGLQHGHFNEAHTVYKLGSAERAADSNPLPDVFVVWGRKYKELFDKQGKGIKPRVEALGFPSYISRAKLSSPKEEKGNEILWCLTTKECFQLEWDILKNSKELEKFSIKIRLHPVPHVKREDVTDLLGSYPFSFSETQGIEDAIKAADIVMGSAHSTTFIDALVNKRPSLRLISNRWVQRFQSEKDALYDVKNGQELDQVLSKLNQPKKAETHTSEDEFLLLEKAAWKDFIQNL